MKTLKSRAGLLLLGQVLELHEWMGIAVVVAANVTAVLTAQQAGAALRRDRGDRVQRRRQPVP
jgi:inner membrane transporter RhtA